MKAAGRNHIPRWPGDVALLHLPLDDSDQEMSVNVPCSNTSRTIVAYQEQGVEAFRWHYSTRPDVLEVSQGGLIGKLDPWLEPVYEALARECSRELSRETILDDMWLGGDKERVVFALYGDGCPGSVDHNCIRERVGMISRVGELYGGDS